MSVDTIGGGLTVEQMIRIAISREQERKDNEAFLKEQSKPSLEKLSFALRHPETWPEGFWWRFSSCSQCAMGLATQMWPTAIRYPTSGAMSESFGMPIASAQNIFLGTQKPAWYRPWENDTYNVSPEQVADRIDQYIATHK